MSLQILINNQTLDLFPDEIVEFTFQVNDVGELRDQQITFSNGFKIPITSHNNKLFSNVQSLTSGSNVLYRKTECQVRQNNALTIPRGVLIIENVDREGYDVSIYWQSFDFFNSIDKLNLQQLDLSNLIFRYDKFDIPSRMNTSTGVVFPLTSYGGPSDKFDIAYQHHAVYLHTVIDQIFAEQGLNRSGKIFDDPFYKRIVLPFNNEKYRAAYDLQQLRFEAHSSGGQSFSDTGGFFVPVVFPNTIVDPSSGYDSGTSVFRPGLTDPANFKGKLVVELNVRKDVGTDTAEIRIIAARSGIIFPLQSVAFTQNTVDTTKITLEYEDIISRIYEYSVQIKTVIAGPNDIHIEDVSIFSAEVDDDAVAEQLHSIEGFLLFAHLISPSLNLPNMTQKELIKNFYQMFGIITQYDAYSNTLHHFQFQELIDNIPKARDWSDKVISTDFLIEVPRDFAQTNFLKYSPDSKIEDPDLGTGFFTIDDEVLEDLNDEIVLAFSASEDTFYLNHRSGKISRYEFDLAGLQFTKFFNDVKKIFAVYDLEFTLDLFSKGTDLGTKVSGFKGTYFTKNDEPFNLAFDNNLIETHFEGLINSLNQGKSIPLLMKVTELDIAALDFSIPVYLNVKLPDTQLNGYFYIQKIEGVSPGRFPTVTLLKLQ